MVSSVISRLLAMTPFFFELPETTGFAIIASVTRLDVYGRWLDLNLDMGFFGTGI